MKKRKENLVVLILLTLVFFTSLLSILVNKAESSNLLVLAVFGTVLLIGWSTYILEYIKYKKTLHFSSANKKPVQDINPPVYSNTANRQPIESAGNDSNNNLASKETQPNKKRTFVCPGCKKELPIKYIYKDGRCADCFNKLKSEKLPVHTAKTYKTVTFVCRGCNKTLPIKDLYKNRLCTDCYILQNPWEKAIIEAAKSKTPRYYDPYAYERENVWKYQEDLFYIPDLSPARKPKKDAAWMERERYYTDFHENVFIDNRDGHLISANFSVPAFNSRAASRSDFTISYDEMHKMVERYLHEPRVNFSVDDPASLLDLNEDNWEEWLLKNKYKVQFEESKEPGNKKRGICTASGYYMNKGAFRSRSSLTEVIIEEGVNRISDNAFEGCKNLETVSIPQSVNTIGCGAFKSCVNLKEVKLPDGLTDLGPAAFSKCDRIESIKIPGGVIKVGENTFSECINLKSAELCEGVVAIEYGAFEKCEALTTIVLPGSLKKICGYYEEEEDFDGHGRVMRALYYQAAFSNCKSLKKVLFRGTRAQWEQIEIGECNELQKAEVEFDYKL